MNTFFRIALTSFVGFLIGIVVASLMHSGSFQAWERLPAPPVSGARLAGVSFSNLYVEVADSRLYSYSDQCITHDASCWTADQLPDQLANEVCDFGSPSFAITTQPPQNIIACMQGRFTGVESYTDYVYALDELGNIWEWQNGNAGFVTFIVYAIIVVAITTVGAFVGIFWTALSK